MLFVSLGARQECLGAQSTCTKRLRSAPEQEVPAETQRRFSVDCRSCSNRTNEGLYFSLVEAFTQQRLHFAAPKPHWQCAGHVVVASGLACQQLSQAVLPQLPETSPCGSKRRNVFLLLRVASATMCRQEGFTAASLDATAWHTCWVHQPQPVLGNSSIDAKPFKAIGKLLLAQRAFRAKNILHMAGDRTRVEVHSFFEIGDPQARVREEAKVCKDFINAEDVAHRMA